MEVLVYTKNISNDSIDEIINITHQKISNNGLFGELERNFDDYIDVNFKNVTHIINNIKKEDNYLICEIRILDTDMGKMLKSIIDCGYPIQLKPRFKGIRDSNNIIHIKHFYTFDISGITDKNINRILLSIERKKKIKSILGEGVSRFKS